MNNNKYRVMVVEDQAMPRQLFEQFINTSENFILAVSIDNASVADIYCLKENIDLILMDVVTSNGASGLDAAKKIKEKHPNIKIIIVTSMPECSYIDRAKKIGIEGFWYKETSKEKIIDVMTQVMEGNTIYPLTIQRTPIGLTFNTELTKRELEVLREVTGGYTNTEIGEKLHISAAAVKKHIASMLDKTGFRSRTELAVRARESGIVIIERTDDDI